ncbi:unnamed protein product [Prorocentrum cordatum]|uniref:Poly(ADP-ribose) glycohydrolase n=1 Tax=Prorocentrum cordatum TaxID=2364126 RepID=A0ABN9VCT8_9DINO|nr:unnamed protein product [Polarella glacialis]
MVEYDFQAQFAERQPPWDYDRIVRSITQGTSCTAAIEAKQSAVTDIPEDVGSVLGQARSVDLGAPRALEVGVSEPLPPPGLGADKCDLQAELVERFGRPLTDGLDAAEEGHVRPQRRRTIQSACQIITPGEAICVRPSTGDFMGHPSVARGPPCFYRKDLEALCGIRQRATSSPMALVTKPNGVTTVEKVKRVQAGRVGFGEISLFLRHSSVLSVERAAIIALVQLALLSEMEVIASSWTLVENANPLALQVLEDLAFGLEGSEELQQLLHSEHPLLKLLFDREFDERVDIDFSILRARALSRSLATSAGSASEDVGTVELRFGEHDCQDALSAWQEEWPAEKKEWCCSSEELGCETIEQPFDCKSSFDDREEKWTFNKKDSLTGAARTRASAARTRPSWRAASGSGRRGRSCLPAGARRPPWPPRCAPRGCCWR